MEIFKRIPDLESTVARASGLFSWNKEHYHTRDHAMYMLNVFDKYYERIEEFNMEGFTCDEQSALALAIVFHDCVYNPGAGDNEEQSVCVANNVMRDEGIPSWVRKMVAELIMSTKPGAVPESRLQRILHDLDWCCFITYDELLDAERKIMKECRDAGYLLRDVIGRRFEFYDSLYMAKDPILVGPFEDMGGHARYNLMRRRFEFMQKAEVGPQFEDALACRRQKQRRSNFIDTMEK